MQEHATDIKAIGVGLGTMFAGGVLTLTQVQAIIGIAAGAAGLCLTTATFIWRRREHKRRMARIDEGGCPRE